MNLPHTLRINKRYAIIGLALACTALVMLYLVAPWREDIRTVVTTMEAHLSAPSTKSFPGANEKGLSSMQEKILKTAEAQYTTRPISYDGAVLTYSQGVKQAWCADFVSWVMLQAGARYSNPNSGSWRIPGVFTLQQYYEANHRYVEVGSYRPQPGDVAFYIGKSDLGLTTSSHVALVVSVQGNEMTTIGGNEGGRLRIDTQPIKAGVNRLVGFGRLTSNT